MMKKNGKVLKKDLGQKKLMLVISLKEITQNMMEMKIS